MSDDINLLITKPGALTPDDKAILREAGIIVIETDEPDSIRFVRPGVDMDSNDMFYASMMAILKGNDTSTKCRFAEQVALVVKGNKANSKMDAAE